jgi:hypothetical protein
MNNEVSNPVTFTENEFQGCSTTVSGTTKMWPVSVKLVFLVSIHNRGGLGLCL